MALMDMDLLQPDCTKCAALCCVALALDPSDMFAIDKPAGVACPNLNDGGRCDIHGDLEGCGFLGCVRYDCLGAGPRVTQDLFAGKTWQQDPELRAPMMAAFWKMLRVHAQMSLLVAAGDLPLGPDQETGRLDLLARMQPQTIAALEALVIEKEVEAFLASLRDVVTGRDAVTGRA